jgi:hypothetical protein
VRQGETISRRARALCARSRWPHRGYADQRQRNSGDDVETLRTSARAYARAQFTRGIDRHGFVLPRLVINQPTIAEKMEGMDRPARAAYMRDLLNAEGIDHDFFAVDEGHSLLNRAGKEDSRMAMVLDAVSDNMGTYVNARRGMDRGR